MTDRETIKKEIERLKAKQLAIFSKGESEESCGDALTHIGAYNQLLSFIDSLPEEPVSEELEKELSAYVNSKEYTNSIGTSGLLLIARHIANWQKEKDQSVIELAEDHAMLAGMEKMKEEMMAKAVDAKLLEGHLIRQKGVTHPLHIGDKVKVIIIKED